MSDWKNGFLCGMLVVIPQLFPDQYFIAALAGCTAIAGALIYPWDYR